MMEYSGETYVDSNNTHKKTYNVEMVYRYK